MTKLLGYFGTLTAATTMVGMISSLAVEGKNLLPSSSNGNHRGLETKGEKIFDLGNKRLEGIHALTPEDVVELGITGGSGKYVLVTEFFYGGVRLVDVEEETFSEYLVPPMEAFAQRGGLGVTYTNGHILVAGAGPLLGLPFEVYVYNPQGELITTCVPPEGVDEGFFNDFEVVGDVAYVTDSVQPRLWSFQIPDAIAGNCDLQYQELDAVFDPAVQETTIESNGKYKGWETSTDAIISIARFSYAFFSVSFEGIVSVGYGFLIALFNSGGVYYFNPDTLTSTEVIPRGTFGRPDGLELVTEIDGSLTLYVTVGESNNLFVYKVAITDTVPTTTFLATIESTGYDTPATSAVLGDQIYTANLRGDAVPLLESNEDILGNFTERFTVVGTSRLVDGLDIIMDDSGAGIATIMTLTSALAMVAGSVLFAFM